MKYFWKKLFFFFFLVRHIHFKSPSGGLWASEGYCYKRYMSAHITHLPCWASWVKGLERPTLVCATTHWITKECAGQVSIDNTALTSLFLSLKGSVYQRPMVCLSIAGRARDKDNNWERPGRCLCIPRQDETSLALRPALPRLRWLKRMASWTKEVKNLHLATV